MALVNFYVAYIAANTLIWKKKGDTLLNHCKVCKMVTLALLSLMELYDKREEEVHNNNEDDSKYQDKGSLRSVDHPGKKLKVHVTTKLFQRLSVGRRLK